MSHTKPDSPDTGIAPGQLSPSSKVELTLARHLIKPVIYLGPVPLLVFGIWKGWAGFWGATVGLGLVVANFLVAGYILSRAAEISPTMYHAAALFGFFLRLGLLIASMLLLWQLVELDRLSFGLTAVTVYMTLLILESIGVARGKERKLEWA